MRLFPTSKLTNQANFQIPRLPANPSRVDRFIVDLFREYTKVIKFNIKLKSKDSLRIFKKSDRE